MGGAPAGAAPQHSGLSVAFPGLQDQDPGLWWAHDGRETQFQLMMFSKLSLSCSELPSKSAPQTEDAELWYQWSSRTPRGRNSEKVTQLITGSRNWPWPAGDPLDPLPPLPFRACCPSPFPSFAGTAQPSGQLGPVWAIGTLPSWRLSAVAGQPSHSHARTLQAAGSHLPLRVGEQPLQTPCGETQERKVRTLALCPSTQSCHMVEPSLCFPPTAARLAD